MNSTVPPPTRVHRSVSGPAATAWPSVHETSWSPTRIVARPSWMPTKEIVVPKIPTVEPVPPSVTEHSSPEQDTILMELEPGGLWVLLAAAELLA